MTVVYCPDCGEEFYSRQGGVAASVLWSQHYAKEHTIETSMERFLSK
jgi:hypothetical protein